MKKLLCSILTTFMLFLVGTSVMASEKSITVKVTDLTREEYLKILAEDMGITVEEADKYDKEQTKKTEARLKKQYPELFADTITTLAETNSYAYKTVQHTEEYPENDDFSAKVVATLKIYASGSFRQIVDVTGVSSRRVSGTYDYDWEENYAWTSPSAEEVREEGATAIDIGANGYFVVEVPYEINLGGFGFGGAYGNTFRYESEEMDIIFEYDLYDSI